MELKPCQCGYQCGITHLAEGEEKMLPPPRPALDSFFRVRCPQCGMMTEWHGSAESAAAVWNHRPVEDALSAELEAARAELAAERGRLDWCIRTHTAFEDGQTARDVIDRLRKEAFCDSHCAALNGHEPGCPRYEGAAG